MSVGGWRDVVDLIGLIWRVLEEEFTERIWIKGRGEGER